MRDNRSRFCHDGAVTDPQSAPRTARARARAELTAEIVETARAHLAVDGAAGLSLRAVARDLGMVSSAIYRYFPSRDDLLTRLIIDAYNSLGEAAEEATADVRDPRDLRRRWLVIAHACRDWALEQPQEWALIYGSPVPGYRAPQDTIGPASRVPVLLIAILADLTEAGGVADPRPVPRSVHAALKPVHSSLPDDVPDDLLVRGLMAWTGLIGAISLEINGQFVNVIDDVGDYFDHTMVRTAEVLGLG